MVRIKKPSWYSFELDNYSAPSCTSSTKTYFGTIEDFKGVISGRASKTDDELKNTFERFAAGERKIIYNAGFIKTRFAKPAILIEEKNIAFDSTEYRFTNVYGFYYYVRFDRAEGKVYLLKQGKSFYVVYRMSLINPIFSDKVIDIWNRLGDMLWGFPGVLKYNRKDKILTNMLGLIESKFDNEQAAREHFNSLSSFEWSRFFEDVFGDG
ncbi:MAG: hypothetical protein OSJ61_07740 [Lachnospiraceae bacterium]|nr:hypothetical protein [Lachnospiraceae bacterium]